MNNLTDQIIRGVFDPAPTHEIIQRQVVEGSGTVVTRAEDGTWNTVEDSVIIEYVVARIDTLGNWRSAWSGALVLSWDEDRKCWADYAACEEYPTVSAWAAAQGYQVREVSA